MKGWKERVAKNKVAKAPKRRPRYGAVEQPTIVHSFDGIDGIHRSGGAVKIEPIEPSQKSTPESSPAPIKTTEPLPLPPRRANLSRGKPGQFGCLLGPATSIPIVGHVTIRIIASVWKLRYARITPIWHDSENDRITC